MKFNPIEIIRKKRNGGTLTREEMEFFIRGILDAGIPDYQAAAFLMAVYFQSMSFEETSTFADCMLHSGVVVDLSNVPGIKVDKHSTGGVGDKVSIILAPMVAACGVPVPMISGRGLGHTGGTLDKLESIPGFRTDLSLKEYVEAIRKTGVVMIGQTAEIAPADKRLYALRDVSGTVESIPLIAGSIMSKKLAEGIDALVLDVKTGHGAFMESEERAIALAQMLIAVGKRFGKKTIGFLTDMSQPLGFAVGNWLEVVECIDCLQGKEVPDLMEVTYVLGGAMVMLGGKAKTIEEGMWHCRRSISSGSAWKKFLEMARQQKGDVSSLENPGNYPKSKYQMDLKADTDGYISKIDALETGFVGIILGAGRTRLDEKIDMKAGIVFQKKVGDAVKKEERIAVLYSDKEDALGAAVTRLKRAVTISSLPPKHIPLIRAMIDDQGINPWS
ncbi:MAG TPA: thymidine phosphorylase [Bacteroidota bacterium]|nr:thymidine phosphorylase [Bacteroidota bacterium]